MSDQTTILQELQAIRQMLSDVLQCLQEARSQVAATPLAPPMPIAAPGGLERLGDAVERYVTEKTRSGDWGHSAEYMFTRHLTSWVAWCRPDMTVADVDRAGLLAYRDHQVSTGLGASTVNQHLTVIGGFCRWAMMEGLLDKDPTTKVKLKVRKKRSRKPFTEDQLATVLTTFEDSYAEWPEGRFLPRLMALTGARPEELVQLRWGDMGQVSPNSPLCLDLRGLPELKTQAAGRVIPLSRQALAVMETVGWESADPDAPLFGPRALARKRRKALPISQAFGRMLRREGFDETYVLYSIRHRCATRLKGEGIDEALVAQLLGHEHPNITYSRYGQEVEPGKLLPLVEALQL